MAKPRPLSSEEKELLSRFVHFEISLTELLLNMREVLEFTFTPNTRTLAANFLSPEPGVPVTLSDIDFAVAKNEIGEISKDELTKWATMLLLNQAYEWHGADEDEVSGRLNDLSMPQLFLSEKP